MSLLPISLYDTNCEVIKTDKNTTFVVHQAWSTPLKVGYDYRYRIRLIVQEFFQEQPKGINYVDSIYPVNEESLSKSYSFRFEAPEDPFKFVFELKCSVNAEGLCGVWRRLLFVRRPGAHLEHYNVDFVMWDMYNKKFDDWYDTSSVPWPEYPVSAALTFHGHEFVMSKREWRMGIRLSDNRVPVVQGDCDFVVVFEESDYAVITL